MCLKHLLPLCVQECVRARDPGEEEGGGGGGGEHHQPAQVPRLLCQILLQAEQSHQEESSARVGAAALDPDHFDVDPILKKVSTSFTPRAITQAQGQ